MIDDLLKNADLHPKLDKVRALFDAEFAGIEASVKLDIWLSLAAQQTALITMDAIRNEGHQDKKIADFLARLITLTDVTARSFSRRLRGGMASTVDDVLTKMATEERKRRQ